MKKSFQDWFHITLKARALFDEKYNIITNVSECKDNGNRYKAKRYDLYWFYLCTDIDNAKNLLYTGTLDEIQAYLKGFELAQKGVRP